MTDLKIDITKLSAELFELAKFSDVPNPDVTRVMLSDTDLAARKYLIGLFRAAGLQVRIDAAGNIFSRWQGSDGSCAGSRHRFAHRCDSAFGHVRRHRRRARRFGSDSGIATHELQTAAIDRADHVHLRGADALTASAAWGAG